MWLDWAQSFDKVIKQNALGSGNRDNVKKYGDIIRNSDYVSEAKRKAIMSSGWTKF